MEMIEGEARDPVVDNLARTSALRMSEDMMLPVQTRGGNGQHVKEPRLKTGYRR